MLTASPVNASNMFLFRSITTQFLRTNDAGLDMLMIPIQKLFCLWVCMAIDYCYAGHKQHFESYDKPLFYPFGTLKLACSLLFLLYHPSPCIYNLFFFTSLSLPPVKFASD